ncbi:Glucan endo-1,3-beta-glucosidase 5 [Linum perenne]
MGLMRSAYSAAVVAMVAVLMAAVDGFGVNWGTQATHPLAPATVVRMMKDNGIQKVKLFDANTSALNALRGSGIQVMLGIPNDMLLTLSRSSEAADKWVAKNLSSHVSHGVDIRYVAVGNEAFLKALNGTYMASTLPALQKIQSAISKAGLSNKVKVSTPLNADVYESASNRPSDGDFRADIRDLMMSIVKFLSDNGSPFIVNIYPFISLYKDSNFPVGFAFFDSNSSTSSSAPIDDGGTTYTNVFDANHDTLVHALQKNGFGNMSIIIGEIGWPTDGDRNANLNYAQQFNQGFMTRVNSGQGTPLRPGPVDAYLFSLIDEDAKSVEPGNFERHWGLFYYDGQPKYELKLTANSNGLVPAKDVQYLPRRWCVMSPDASLDNQDIGPSVSYACGNADCTSLGYGTSCSNLDQKQNISYAFNDYYQQNDQQEIACKFKNLSMVTSQDPSVGQCRFRVMIETDLGTWLSASSSSGAFPQMMKNPLRFAMSMLVGLVLMFM